MTAGSIIGEDGYLYDEDNSYSVKSTCENGVIYRISTQVFKNTMEKFKKDFGNLLQKRHNLIEDKIINLEKNKQFKQSLAGPPLDQKKERSKEQYEIHKKFKYARMFPKRQFHLQLKKKNIKKADIILSANNRYKKPSINIKS